MTGQPNPESRIQPMPLPLARALSVALVVVSGGVARADEIPAVARKYRVSCSL